MSDSVAASTLDAERDACARHAWSEAFEPVSAVDAEHGAHRRGSQLAGLAYSAYEAARARLLVAQGHRTAGHDDAARLQLQAAASTFERLGARPNIRNRLGQPTRAATVAHAAKLGLL